MCPFLDSVEVDGMGKIVTCFECADAELESEIGVCTVQERVKNADDSVNFIDPLVGSGKYSQAEFDAHTFAGLRLKTKAYLSRKFQGCGKSQ